MQAFLSANCDNHPLAVGALAGLIAHYLPERGNFDLWKSDPYGGMSLNLAQLDLKQRRNHILLAAVDAITAPSRHLLFILSLLSDSVSIDTLRAFNPHVPPEPKQECEPSPPEDDWRWMRLNQKKRDQLRERYEEALAKRTLHNRKHREWKASAPVGDSTSLLSETVRDLERRGLLQYNRENQRYDLHPVVRSVVSAQLNGRDKEHLGEQVVDYFSSTPQSPYKNADSWEDVEAGRIVVRTLIRIGQFDRAASAFCGGLDHALSFNLEAHAETLSLVRPLFLHGWGCPPAVSDVSDGSVISNWVGIALHFCGEEKEAMAAFVSALNGFISLSELGLMQTVLGNISICLSEQQCISRALRLDVVSLELSHLREYPEDVFKSLLLLFVNQSRIGNWDAASETWQQLDPMGRNWTRAVYRQGRAEYQYAEFLFWQNQLTDSALKSAMTSAEVDHNRVVLRRTHRLSAFWKITQLDWEGAKNCFQEALRLARERQLVDAESETGLALAKVRTQLLNGDEARIKALRLAQLRRPAHRYLAMLWQAIGDREQAKQHALAAYKWAWADGEPYVHRYELTKTTELLLELGVPIPELPPYDPAKDVPFPWEADVRAAIEKLKAEKEEKKK
jgi:tetratricopeptide (TPR) repeat protein